MFNLLVKAGGWADIHDTFSRDRLFEHTSDELIARFSQNGAPDFQALLQLPCFFMNETNQRGAQVAHVGMIHRATIQGAEVVLDHTFDLGVPRLTNTQVEVIATQLQMVPWEFNRTHWAVKDVDLFKVILRNLPRRSLPQVFRIADPESINPTLISAMMPFAANFTPIYEAIQQVATELNLTCQRADDIWVNHAVMQDVVHLIDTSHVVICDCTGRNPNVFYEAGIAHTLGREVILITQSHEDIPFDLRHLRYIHYLNNDQGRAELVAQLRARVRDLI